METTCNMKEADGTLENVIPAKGKRKVITAHYACCNALYAIFMKCGIKCEIHDCTIELMEKIGFDRKECEYMRKPKEDRIQVQYCLKRRDLKSVEDVKKFVLRCKAIPSPMTSEEIEDIRIELKREASA